jgi:hypothetical protein
MSPSIDFVIGAIALFLFVVVGGWIVDTIVGAGIVDSDDPDDVVGPMMVIA